jgi:hypothetical protein
LLRYSLREWGSAFLFQKVAIEHTEVGALQLKPLHGACRRVSFGLSLGGQLMVRWP